MNERASLLRKLSGFIVKRCKRRKQNEQINPKKNAYVDALYDETTKLGLSIEKNQIYFWYNRFSNENQILGHPYLEIALICMNSCMHDQASDFYLRFLKDGKNKDVQSLYLQNLMLSASSTNESLLKAHIDWARNYLVEDQKTISHDKAQKVNVKKIKIGYVCHFFTNGISQNCLLPFLKLHDKNKFEVYCYNDGDMPENREEYSQHWRDIRSLSDEQVADIIHQDGIDILQELNGFCIINRFGALAYRPAPIQINWYNHTSTTGLPFIDYVMSDEISIQEKDLPYFVESAYRNKNFIAAVNFDENKFGNLIQHAPCETTGQITFGYFGSSHKITLHTIELWSSILKRVPGSRLVLKSGSFTHHLYRHIFKNHFAKQGIQKNQIVFEGWSDQTSTLRQYNEIDIMLDSTPVNGGSTMFEALMQGVPAISLMGNRWAARSGPSVLTTLNHPELIAHTSDEYIDIAVKLANDIPRLSHYRKNLRSEMRASSLTNIQTFYNNFEKAYLQMWDNWLSGANAAS